MPGGGWCRIIIQQNIDLRCMGNEKGSAKTAALPEVHRGHRNVSRKAKQASGVLCKCVWSSAMCAKAAKNIL